MKLRIVLPLIAIIVLALTFSASAFSYIGLGASYRSFSSDELWSAGNWQENLKGALHLGLGVLPGVRVNMAVYTGFGGFEALPEEVDPSAPIISLSAKAGIDYDLLKYDNSGTYLGFGPTAGISYSNVPYGAIAGKADFNMGIQTYLSLFSGKLELEGSVSYTFRDAFVNGGVMLRYNPASSFVIYSGLDYLRRDGFAILGVGVRF